MVVYVTGDVRNAERSEYPTEADRCGWVARPFDHQSRKEAQEETCEVSRGGPFLMSIPCDEAT